MIEKAIILAGGLGTRLRPLTDETPKPLLPLKGKPIVQHIIENLQKHGVQNIILSIGYHAEKIQNYFQDGSSLGVHISYSIETEPLGTGGAIKKAAAGITTPFFLIWGDNLMDINFTKMYEENKKEPSTIRMALTPRDDVEHFGVAKLEGNKIVTFVEKPKREDAPSNLINAGAFIVDPKCLAMLPEGISSMEKDCFEKLAPLGEITAFIHDGQWFPTDTLEKYSLACMKFIPHIDFHKKNVIIADVDETICETCQQISPEMAEQINNMIQQGYEFAFISGTKMEDLVNMISSRIKEPHHLLATTGTNYTFVKNGIRETKYRNSFTQEEKKEIFDAFKNVIDHFKIRTMTTPEDQLQDRDSQITFSAIGRNAPIEIKKRYDPNEKKRKIWVRFLKGHIDESKYEIKIGGTTSIDVTRKGLDKEWGITEFAKYHHVLLSNILFFGDKIYPGGNDYPAARIVDCIAVKNPHETLRELKKL